MNKEIVSTPNAPSAIGPYSQAVKTGLVVFLSGQIGVDPATKELGADFAAQVRQAFKNLEAVARASGGSLANVVKVGVFLRDMKDFDVFNRVFREYFKGVQPARTTVEAAAPRKGVNVEIDAIAFIPR